MPRIRSSLPLPSIIDFTLDSSGLWLYTMRFYNDYYLVDRSTASNLSDNIISLSDRLAITSSFILSFSLNT